MHTRFRLSTLCSLFRTFIVAGRDRVHDMAECKRDRERPRVTEAAKESPNAAKSPSQHTSCGTTMCCQHALCLCGCSSYARTMWSGHRRTRCFQSTRDHTHTHAGRYIGRGHTKFLAIVPAAHAQFLFGLLSRTRVGAINRGEARGLQSDSQTPPGGGDQLVSGLRPRSNTAQPSTAR